MRFDLGRLIQVLRHGDPSSQMEDYIRSHQKEIKAGLEADGRYSFTIQNTTYILVQEGHR